MAKVQKGKTEFCLQGMERNMNTVNKHTKSMSLVTLTDKVYCAANRQKVITTKKKTPHKNPSMYSYVCVRELADCCCGLAQSNSTNDCMYNTYNTDLHWMAQYWKTSSRKEMGMRKGATQAAQLHWKMLPGSPSLLFDPIILLWKIRGQTHSFTTFLVFFGQVITFYNLPFCA